MSSKSLFHKIFELFGLSVRAEKSIAIAFASYLYMVCSPFTDS